MNNQKLKIRLFLDIVYRKADTKQVIKSVLYLSRRFLL